MHDNVGYLNSIPVIRIPAGIRRHIQRVTVTQFDISSYLSIPAVLAAMM